MKKLSLYFLTLILVFNLAFLSVSCSSGNTNGGNSTTIDIVPAETELTIFENNRYNCTIVYPDKASDEIQNTAFNLSLYLAKVTNGIVPNVVSDIEYEGKDTSADNMILIGKTSIKGTEAAFENSKYSAVHTCLVDNKYQVIINDSDGGVHFLSTVNELLGTSPLQTIVIDESWIFDATIHELLGVLELYDGGWLERTVDCGDGTLMKVIKKTSSEEYKAYIEKSKAAGFSLYSENAIGENLFTTMTYDGYNATFVYLANLNETRLIIDPKDAFSLPEPEEENIYTEICSPSITQVGCEIEKDNKQNGMCYIFKLADGRFVIIDSGHAKKVMAERLLSALRDLSDDHDGEITIAAWFLSHLHNDHWGAFKKITDMEDNGLVIERIIYNLPSDRFYNTINDEDDLDATSKVRLEANEYMAKHKNNGTKIYKAHPGQVYHLGNIDFTIYSTAELYAPLSNTTVFNDSCIVVRAEVAGQTLLFPGDSGSMQSKSTIEIFGNELKSDFFQVIHHGYNGGDTDYYELVDPQIVFWPVGIYDYLYREASDGGPVSMREINEYFFRKEGTSLKELFVGGSEIVTLPLPYDKVTSSN